VNVIVEVEVRDSPPAARLPAGSCTVRFDLGNDVYVLRMPADGPSHTERNVGSLDAVVLRCTDTQAYEGSR